MEFNGVLFFLIGLAIGSTFVWYIRQKEIDSIQKNQIQMEAAFGDLSNDALIANQKKFLELAVENLKSN